MGLTDKTGGAFVRGKHFLEFMIYGYNRIIGTARSLAII